jgi:hypothetical protein
LSEDDGHLFLVTNFEDERIIGKGSKEIMVTLWPGRTKRSEAREKMGMRNQPVQTQKSIINPFSED